VGKSRWYAVKDYADLLHEDVNPACTAEDKLSGRPFRPSNIEARAKSWSIRIYNRRPGIIIWPQGI